MLYQSTTDLTKLEKNAIRPSYNRPLKLLDLWIELDKESYEFLVNFIKHIRLFLLYLLLLYTSQNIGVVAIFRDSRRQTVGYIDHLIISVHMVYINQQASENNRIWECIFTFVTCDWVLGFISSLEL